MSQFSSRFPTDAVCMEELRRLRFPKGINCNHCKRTTKHYRVRGRTAYACRYCRKQIYPLSGTIFEKSTTPLRLWFFALFLMAQTEGTISAKQLQRQLGVTYKTAWRMRTLLARNNEDILAGMNEQEKVRKWFFFNKFEFKVAERHSGDS
jgi:transposase